MARAIWTGTINFGLIAIPIKLFTAVRPKSVSFNQLDERTMNRIRYLKVSEDTGEEVPAEHIVKGVEVSKGHYVLVDPDELAPFVPLNTKSIDLDQFVDLAEIDPVYFETTYHVGPHLSPKPYALLARALESAGKVAIARFVMRGRQYVAALRAVDGRLMLSTMAYADEVVPVTEVEELRDLERVEVADREVRMAEMLVESLTSTFEPGKYHDDYREQALELIAKKASGEEFELPAPAGEKPAVVDLMAALEASVQAAKEARTRHPTARAKPAEGAKKAPAKARPRKTA
jgi:DNA end-binding protein Ku